MGPIVDSAEESRAPAPDPRTPPGTGESRITLPTAPLAWSLELREAAQGLAVNPVSGDLYVTVKPSTGAFGKTGGLLVLDSKGRAKAALGTGIGPEQAQPFVPNEPLVAGDGSAVYFGDYGWNLFRYDPAANRAFSLPLSGSRGTRDAAIGIDARSALSSDSKSLLLPGFQLHSVRLPEGKIEPILTAEQPIRQILLIEPELYLLDISERGQPNSRLASWNSKTRSLKKLYYEFPVHALASKADWTVAIVRVDQNCAVTQLRVSDGYMNAVVIGVFRVREPRCADVTLALNPARQQIAVVARSAVMSAGESPGTEEPHDGLLMDFLNKRYYRLDIEKGTSAAFSPDGSALHVTDRSGVKSFRTP
ncbi:MAG: hypothetical protein NDJ90_09475 [Oligoflexia bacterium]|nr:hypothetical protein [Oligoflexia bacterium]